MLHRLFQLITQRLRNDSLLLHATAFRAVNDVIKMKMKPSNVRIVLALSVLALMFSGPILNIAAQPESQGALVEKILQIYEQARELALRWAARAEQAGSKDVADELKRAVENADNLIDQARDKLASGDRKEAAELARRAINTLREALLNAKEEYAPSSNVTRAKGLLLSAIRRLNDLIQKLETSLRALESRGVDVKEPRQKLERAKEMLEDATGLMSEEKLIEAKKKVEGAAELIREAYSWIREHIKEIKEGMLEKRVQRIVSATERTIERLQKLEEWLIQHNRTEAAAKVSEAKNALTQALRKFNDAVEKQNYAAAREALREMLGILRRIRQYVLEYRSMRGVPTGAGG